MRQHRKADNLLSPTRARDSLLINVMFGLGYGLFLSLTLLLCLLTMAGY